MTHLYFCFQKKIHKTMEVFPNVYYLNALFLAQISLKINNFLSYCYIYLEGKV